MRVHSALPDALAEAVDEVLRRAGVEHVAHGVADPPAAAARAAGDDRAVALVGPFRSADVAEAVEVTAPAGLPLLAPVATWAGVTRDDEPGCDDAAAHRGTVLRIVARDTEVAARLAADVGGASLRAFVVAGTHDYGRQLDEQLHVGGLPRELRPDSADLVVLCGLAGEPEIERAAALAPLPVVAFDGVQGARLGAGQVVHVALPMGPGDPVSGPSVGTPQARRAAELVVAGLQGGARDRAALLVALRALGPFDEHGDPLDADVWLWRAADDWALTPERPLPKI